MTMLKSKNSALADANLLVRKLRIDTGVFYSFMPYYYLL
jgi:hypothetical protein